MTKDTLEKNINMICQTKVNKYKENLSELEMQNGSEI